MNSNTKYNILRWLHITFCYIIPALFVLYTYVIAKLIDGDISITKRIGVAGMFALALVLIIGLVLYSKHFKKAIDKLQTTNDQLTDKILLETNEDKKSEYLSLKAKTRDKINKLSSRQELFGNLCFISPFAIFWLVCILIEKGVVSLRGTLLVLTISMVIGFIFNVFSQIVKNKGE